MGSNGKNNMGADTSARHCKYKVLAPVAPIGLIKAITYIFEKLSIFYQYIGFHTSQECDNTA